MRDSMKNDNDVRNRFWPVILFATRHRAAPKVVMAMGVVATDLIRVEAFPHDRRIICPWCHLYNGLLTQPCGFLQVGSSTFWNSGHRGATVGL